MMIQIATTKAALIQIGERTQTKDQSITLQALRTMNAIVRPPTKPIPPDADADAVAELLMILMF